MLELGLATGARVGELFAIRWDAFSADGHMVWIEKQPQPLWSGKAPTYLKSASSRRSTPVLPEWAEFHRPGAEGIVLGGTSGQSRVRAFPLIREEAGLAGILSDGLEGGGAHSLRHTYARRFLEEFGATLAQLSAALGHSSLRKI